MKRTPSLARFSSWLHLPGGVVRQARTSEDSSIVQTQLSGSTIGLQLWVITLPWRPSALWAFLAALLTQPWEQLQSAFTWPTLLLLFLLIDPLWGGIARFASGRRDLLHLRPDLIDDSRRLPYLQEDSPAGRLLGRDLDQAPAILFRVLLPVLVFGFLVAATLGVQAVVATIAVLLLTALGWMLYMVRSVTPWGVYSLIAIGIPWWLTLQLSRAGGVPISSSALLLGLLWTLHYWGEQRVAAAPASRSGLLLLGAADIGLGIWTLAIASPLWFVLWAIATVPTWIAVVNRTSLQRVTFWWVLAMLITAVALGQHPGIPAASALLRV